MNKISLSLVLLIAVFLTGACSSVKTTSNAENPDWKLSMQSYTFHLFTVEESLDKTQQLGLKYIEIYPGQKMGAEFDNAVFGYNLTDNQQKKLKDLAASKGIKIVSSGVWTAGREEWASVFAFADKMDMEFISAEPAQQDWDVVEELAKRYNMKVAVHNHPSESSYWNSGILLNTIQNRSRLIGSSADVGHYKRMGLDPVDCLKQLSGRLIAMHFKDIAPKPSSAELEDVVWGTGVLNVKEMLQELKRQNFKGYFTIEYEANWENNLPEIKESIDYFNKTASEL